MNKKIKLTIIILSSLLVIALGFLAYIYFTREIPKPEENVTIENKTFEYNTEACTYDILEVGENKTIDTMTLGDYSYTAREETEEKIINYTIKYSIVDTTPPLILGSENKSIEKGKGLSIVDAYICADNYDDKPHCFVEGEYDTNKIGEYKMVYYAEDSHGNKNSKDIKLTVVKPSNSSSSSTKRTDISEYIKKYKTENTKIGIDVSAWQSNIDWKKAKNAGVEFAIIRMAYGPSDGKYKFDSKYEKNLKGAKDQGIPVGLYFFSYSTSIEESRKEAQWLVEQLKGTELDLPIAYDWESWSKYNSLGYSIYHFNQMAEVFIEEIEKAGYKGMLYSSAYYLKHIWHDYDYTWLAYYTNDNDYMGQYNIWQLTSSGKVNGISGSVDINILYDPRIEKKVIVPEENETNGTNETNKTGE